jgi:hypothetical protein
MKNSLNRSGANARIKKGEALLRAIEEGRAVVVQLPGAEKEAAMCLDIMVRLHPGLTPQEVAQYLVDDALDQSRKDIGLMNTYSYWAHDAMAKRQEAKRRTAAAGKEARK